MNKHQHRLNAILKKPIEHEKVKPVNHPLMPAQLKAKKKLMPRLGAEVQTRKHGFMGLNPYTWYTVKGVFFPSNTPDVAMVKLEEVGGEYPWIDAEGFANFKEQGAPTK